RSIAAVDGVTDPPATEGSGVPDCPVFEHAAASAEIPRATAISGRRRMGSFKSDLLTRVPGHDGTSESEGQGVGGRLMRLYRGVNDALRASRGWLRIRPPSHLEERSMPVALMALIGLAAGILSGLFGIGGGVVIV